MAGNVPRHRWHPRQPWHCGICKLQNLKDAGEFESHSLRHTLAALGLGGAEPAPVTPPLAYARRERERIPLSPPHPRCARSWRSLAGSSHAASRVRSTRACRIHSLRHQNHSAVAQSQRAGATADSREWHAAGPSRAGARSVRGLGRCVPLCSRTRGREPEADLQRLDVVVAAFRRPRVVSSGLLGEAWWQDGFFSPPPPRCGGCSGRTIEVVDLAVHAAASRCRIRHSAPRCFTTSAGTRPSAR